MKNTFCDRKRLRALFGHLFPGLPPWAWSLYILREFRPEGAAVRSPAREGGESHEHVIGGPKDRHSDRAAPSVLYLATCVAYLPLCRSLLNVGPSGLGANVQHSSPKA